MNTISKTFIICWLLTLHGWGIFAQETSPNSNDLSMLGNYRVAVADFMVNDVSGMLENQDAFVNAIADAFEAALVQSGRFTVVARDDLDSVLEEIALSQSGIIKPEHAISMGQLSGAELLVTGDITFATQVTITINFINAVTGEIDAIANWQTEPNFDFTMAAQELCHQAGAAYAPRGQVIATGARTFVDLGSETGVGDTRTGTLVRESLVAGRRFSESIGRFKISSLGPEASAIEVELEPDFAVEVGDIAMLDSHFSFDTSFSINTMPDVSDQLFGKAIVEVLGDDIPMIINIFSAEGELVRSTSPFEKLLLLRGDYVASPYGRDVYDQAPAVFFTVEAGLEQTVSIDMNSSSKAAHSDMVTHLLYSPDGRYLVSGGRDGWLLIRDSHTNTVVHALDLDGDGVNALALSADGRYMASSSIHRGSNDTVTVWDMKDFSRLFEFTAGFNVPALGFAEDSSEMYIIDDWNETFYRLALPSAKVLLEASLEGVDETVVFHPQGKMFFSNYTNTIYMYNLVTGERMTSYKVDVTSIASLALNPERGWLAVGGEAGKVYLYHLTGKAVTRLRRGGDTVDTLAFSTDGDYLASGARHSYLWDLEDFSVTQDFKNNAGFVNALAFSPDGSELRIAINDKSLHQFPLTP